MGEKYFFILLENSGTDRLRVRIETTKGGVKYFVVQYETLIEDEWVAIVRYDLAHGFFHRDVMNPKGEKEGCITFFRMLIFVKKERICQQHRNYLTII